MGSLVLAGATSGSTTITPTDAVTATVTLPSTGGTLQTSGAGFTTNGVAYATSTSALATGSALTFNGTTLTNSSTTGSISKTGAVTSLALATGDTYSLSTSLGVLGLDSGATALSIRMNYGGYYLPFSFNKYGVMSVGGATPSTSGAGITFPATQQASSDANTLDDYETGTFTPTAYGGSVAGTTTYTLQQGTYTKIGRQVTIAVRISYSALTGSGELTFGNFPFTASNDGMEYMGALMTDALNWNGGTYLQFYKNANTSYGVIFYMSDDVNWGVQQCVNESAAMRFTITYFV